MSAFHNNMLLGSVVGADPGDPIDQSLRFRGTQLLETPYFGSTNTFGSNWTISFWVKFAGPINTTRQIIATGTRTAGSNYAILALNDGTQGKLEFDSGGYTFNFNGALFRDPSAWYHILMTNSEVYVNGEAQGAPANYWSNFDGCDKFGFSNGTFTPLSRATMYLADAYLVQQTLTASTFGRYNADGVWVPKTPTIASYGTQGFHLTLDPTQSNGIGHDSSGQGNHCTATGFDVTSGDSSYDVMVDSPTNNFSTMNPLDPFSDTLSDANLALSVATSQHAAPGTMALVENKYYIELTCDNPPTLSPNRQYALFLVPTSGITNANPVLSSGAYEIKVFNNTTFGVYTSNSAVLTGTLPSTPAAGFVIQVLYNADTRQLYACVDNTHWLRNNGSIASTFDAAQPTLVLAAPTSGHYTAGVTNYNGTGNINYGQQPYLHTPPTGFEALSTTNMPSAALSNTITGTFTGNNSADGPFVYTGCLPARIQYGTIDIKFQNRLSQSNVDFLSNGFKVRSTTSNNGSVSYTVTTTHDGGEYVGYQIPFNAPATAQTN